MMSSRTAQFAARLVEAGWLTAVIAIPVFFNVWSNRVFEPDKLTLLRSIALLMSAAGVVYIAESKLPSIDDLGRWLRIPVVAPILALTAVIAFASATSWVRRLSFLGSYTRLQGLYTWLAYIVVFIAIVALLRRREQLDRLILALIIPSLPVALYGIVQKFGLDPMPWLGDVTFRVASTMGNSIFVSAYLIMAVPLTAMQLVSALRELDEDEGLPAVLRVSGYLVLLMVQVMAIWFSQSRGPFVGFLGGIALLGLLMAAMWGRRDLVMVILALAVAVGAFLVVFNLPGSPLAPLRDAPYIGRMGRIFETGEGTGKVRVLIWAGAVDLIRDDPLRALIGYGPESMHIAYNRFYQPELAHYESRNASPDRAHNETLDVLVQTGLIGFAVYLALFTSLFYYGLKWLGLIGSTGQRNLFLALWFGGGVASALGFYLWSGNLTFFGVALPAGMVAGLFAFVALQTLRGWLPGERTGGLVLAGLLAALYAHFIEIHFGIAIAATRTLFFAMAGALVVVGALADERQELLAPPSLPTTGAPGKIKRRGRRAASRAAAQAPSDRAWLAAACLVLMLTIVLGYDMLVDVTTGDSSYWLVLTWIIGLTWALGSLIAVTEVLVLPQSSTSGLGKYLIFTLGGLGLYAVVHSMVLYLGIQARAGPDVSSNLLLVFYGTVFVALVVWAWRLLQLDPAPGRFSMRRAPWLYPLVGLVAVGIAVVTNVNEVRADIYYKQAYVRFHSEAGSYQASGDWDTARLYYDYANRNYDRAMRLDPAEDYYQLFKGKVLLEEADGNAAQLEALLESELGDEIGEAGFSEYSLVGTNSELGPRVVERDRMFESALQVLNRALATAPLNTDHHANLGRAYQVWGDRTLDAEKRKERLALSRDWFESAIELSPNNAQLREEMATTEYLAGNTEEALRLIDEALAIDSEYGRPFKLRATIHREAGDWEAAAADYRRYVESREGKNDTFGWSALAFVLGQMDDLEGAREANERVLELLKGQDDLPTLRNLAIISRDLGDRLAACEYALRGLNMDPENPDPGLSQLWVELDCGDAAADEAGSEVEVGPPAPEPTGSDETEAEPESEPSSATPEGFAPPAGGRSRS